MFNLPLDRKVSKEEDEQGYVLDQLLYFFPGPYVMLSAYLDESGSHDASPAMCVAGLLYTRQKVKLLDRAWKKALEKAGVASFHANEMANSQGEFKALNQETKNNLHRQLIKLIKRYVCGGAVAYIVSEKQFKDYKKNHSWKYSQYTTCTYACLSVLRGTAARIDDGHLDLTIEDGHKNMGELSVFLRNLREVGFPITHGFRDKYLRPLQTADLWAYEAWKRMNESFNVSQRPIRKSLQALLEVDQKIEVVSLNHESLPVLFEEVRSFLGQ